MKCTIAACLGEAETVYRSFALCEEHLEGAWELPDKLTSPDALTYWLMWRDDAWDFLSEEPSLEHQQRLAALEVVVFAVAAVITQKNGGHTALNLAIKYLQQYTREDLSSV